MTHCRFIPSHSLTAHSLDYILLPEEAAWTLQRINTPKQIHQSLPSGLKLQMEPYSHRHMMEYLSHLQRELARGTWIALSMRPRKHALPEIHLRRYPLLAQTVNRAQNQPRHYRKAHYDMVVSDTPLQKELVYVPVEPIPEHKIVVEFAGQWLGNSAGLRLNKTDTQSACSAKPIADAMTTHRSLATFKGLEPCPRNLYLTVPIRGNIEPLKLLLAEGLTPVDKQADQEEWDHVLVPIRPLAYLNGAKDKTQAAELKGGYLYVFWKNQLWREFNITDKGFYQDIDVGYYRFRDKTAQRSAQPTVEYREAEGFPLPQFWVPYKINGEIQQGEKGIKLLFSPTQQPYSRIDALEADSNKLNACATPLDELSVYSENQAFSAQENISDIPSAQLHAVTSDDMPWLTDIGTVIRSLDDSNTVAAYVDGHNNHFVFKVETGLDDEFTGANPILFAVIEDANSEWQQTMPLEPATTENSGHYSQAIISGLPSDGMFTLYVTNPADPDSAEVVFADISHSDIVSPPSALEPAIDTGNEPEPDYDAEQQISAQQRLMAMWQNEVLSI
ncbi:hypothetical protein [Photobacterium nomapromontoriensis]|uniref:hypothetical protein n=1 Tax=Photobacterium nomapromontoriensis TaxID=2910237 RepID=UPI003D12D332